MSWQLLWQSKAKLVPLHGARHLRPAVAPRDVQWKQAAGSLEEKGTRDCVPSTSLSRSTEPRKLSRATRRLLVCGTILGSVLIQPGREPKAEAQVSAENCAQCSGLGVVRCGLCQGSGRWLVAIRNGFEVLEKCPQCVGTGKLKCIRCLGTGLGNTAGLLRGPAVKEGKLRVRPDGSIEILDCDFFPATRGKQCRSPEASEDTNLITEERANKAPRGQLYPRPDTVM